MLKYYSMRGIKNEWAMLKSYKGFTEYLNEYYKPVYNASSEFLGWERKEELK